MNGASPQWPVAGGFFKFFWLYIAPLEVCFDCVLVPLLWTPLVSSPKREFTVEKPSRHPVFFHSNGVSDPAELGFDDGRLNACGVGTVQNFKVCDTVLPANGQYRAKGSHVKVLKFLDVSPV